MKIIKYGAIILFFKEVEQDYVRSESSIPIAKRLEEVSNGVTTQIFFRFSKVNLLADSLPNYKELATLAKKREDRVVYYPQIMQDQKRINEILDSYESKTIWQ